jgi:cytochrome c-type biogenesis protein CcmH
LFWIASVLLIVMAAAFVLFPLWRHHLWQQSLGGSDRNAANLVIFDERLHELETELAEGVLDQAQFDALKTELERSLLSDVSDVDVEQRAQTPMTWFSASRLVPLLVLLAMVPASFIFYEMWGFRDDLHFRELVERHREAQGDPQQARDLIFAFGAVIERDAENGWAWYFMGRSLADLGQIEEAAMALGRAAPFIENEEDRAVVLGQYAQLEYMVADRQITPQVQDIINRAQRLNPFEQSVLQLLSTDAWIREDYQSAITYWQQLLTLNPSPDDREFLQSAIAQARDMLAERGDTVEQISGPVLQIELALAPGLELTPDTRVFVSAQASDRPGPPLAATVLSVGQLPTTITLSAADAVGPDNLGSAEEVMVVATASLSGTANVQSGDYQGRILNVRHEGGKVELSLLIGDEVP